MPDPSAGEVGGVFAGAVAMLYAIGKGLAWVLSWDDRRRETRWQKLQRWHDELEQREEKLERVQADHWHRIEAEFETLRRQHAALRGGYQLIAGALRVIDPGNAALSHADELLKAAWPLDPLLPDEMTALVLRAKRPEEN